MTEDQYIRRIIEDYIIGCDEEVMWSKWNGTDWSGPVAACVVCSDTFVWASADAEHIDPEDIDDIIEFSKEGERRGCYDGPLMWVCKKRNHHPMPQYMVDKYCDEQWRNWLSEVVPNPTLIARTWWKKDETPI